VDWIWLEDFLLNFGLSMEDFPNPCIRGTGLRFARGTPEPENGSSARRVGCLEGGLLDVMRNKLQFAQGGRKCFKKSIFAEFR